MPPIVGCGRDESGRYFTEVTDNNVADGLGDGATVQPSTMAADQQPTTDLAAADPATANPQRTADPGVRAVI